MPSSNRRQGLERLTTFTVIATVAAALALRLILLRRHAFNPDEFQHLHGAWGIAHGLLPYRDYFEHHTPWLHFFLAPFLAFFDVDTSPASAETFVFFARGWMVVFSGLSLALTYRLGKIWAGAATGAAGVLLLGTTVMFLDKTLEIRPDVPAVAFLLGSWVALLLAFRRGEEGETPGGLFARSGLLLGVAILCTQKVLFALPASAVLWAVYLLERRDQRGRRTRHLLFTAAGALAPIGAMLAVFATRGGLRAFVDFNLLTNLGWQARFSPAPLLRWLFEENTFMVVLGLAGLAERTIALVRMRPGSAASALIPVQAIGLGVGVFLMPVPYAQYLVLLLPLLALLAADVLVRVWSAASRLQRPSGRIGAMAAVCAVAAAFTFAPLRTMALMVRSPNTKLEDSLARLRFVVANTAPSDTLFDGFSGLGVFRPHAYFYFFLHDEMRLLLQDEGMSRLLAELRDGVVAPDWVVMDADVQALPRRIVAFFRKNYEASPMAPLWRRKDIWLDDGRWLDFGEGPTDALAGRGWDAPERADGHTFRRVRGRSSIRAPLKDPAACRLLIVRASPSTRGRTDELQAAPLGDGSSSGAGWRTPAPSAAQTSGLEPAVPKPAIEVSANDVSIGIIRLSPGWRDYAVPLAGKVLRRGMNVLQFAYDPLHNEGETRVLVDGLKFECLPSPE